MDGLLRSIGEGITGLVGGAIAAIGQVFGGMIDALARVVPGGLVTMAGIGLALILVWLVFKR
jgi:hypothetical protein